MNRDDFDPASEAYYANMLREQGVWADRHMLCTCGPSTGHFVRAIAYCEDGPTARALAAAFSPNAVPLPGSISIADLAPLNDPS